VEAKKKGKSVTKHTKMVAFFKCSQTFFVFLIFLSPRLLRGRTSFLSGGNSSAVIIYLGEYIPTPLAGGFV